MQVKLAAVEAGSWCPIFVTGVVKLDVYSPCNESSSSSSLKAAGVRAMGTLIRVVCQIQGSGGNLVSVVRDSLGVPVVLLVHCLEEDFSSFFFPNLQFCMFCYGNKDNLSSQIGL